MVWGCNFTCLKVLTVLPKGTVMTIFGLKSTGDAFVKKLISTAFNIPKQILKFFFGIQIKIMYLTFGYLVQISRTVQNSAIFKYVFPEKVSSPVIDHKAVVKGAKKLRRALCLSLQEYYGLDLKSDLDLMKERLEEVHKCMEEDDDDKTLEALAKLKELNKPFEDESWKETYIRDLEVCEYTDDESETKDTPTNMLAPECDNNNEVTSGVHKKQDNLKSNEVKCEQSSGTHLQRPSKNKLANSTLRNKLRVANSKLEEALQVSSNLFGELTRMNTIVHQLAVVNDKMVEMQNELGEGRKLMNEIEAERNELRTKLTILERMIKEEEQYLDDISCESGYDESETHSPEC